VAEQEERPEAGIGPAIDAVFTMCPTPTRASQASSSGGGVASFRTASLQKRKTPDTACCPS